MIAVVMLFISFFLSTGSRVRSMKYDSNKVSTSSNIRVNLQSFCQPSLEFLTLSTPTPTSAQQTTKNTLYIAHVDNISI